MLNVYKYKVNYYHEKSKIVIIVDVKWKYIFIFASGLTKDNFSIVKTKFQVILC